MKRTTYVVAALVLAVFSSGAGTASESPVLYDFENDTEGWVVDWGLEQAPTQVKRNAAHGHGALAIDHHFRKDHEAIALKALLAEARDFTSVPGFDGFSAWVYLPSANWWEAQLYVSTGDRWEVSWGKIAQKLDAGWHRITISKNEISDPQDVRAIGIQIKNFTVNTQARIYVDYVQVVSASTSQAEHNR